MLRITIRPSIVNQYNGYIIKKSVILSKLIVMKLFLLPRILLYICFVPILFAFGIFYIFFYDRPQNNDAFAQYPFTEVVYQYSLPKQSLSGKDILAGEKIRGQFRASAKNLGTVAIKFDTHNKINWDLIIFRIREKGKSVWYSENTYRTDQIRQEVFWPFGFNLIGNSEGKPYEFEIESFEGIPGDAIAINSSQNSFIAKYSYPKQWLLKNKQEIPYFIKHKIVSFFNSLDNTSKFSIIITLLLSLILPFIFSKLITVLKNLSRADLRAWVNKFTQGTKIVILLARVSVNIFRNIVHFFLHALRFFSRACFNIYRKIPFLIITTLILLCVGTYAALLDQRVFFEDTRFMSLSTSHRFEKTTLNKVEFLGKQLKTGQRPLDEKNALLAGQKIRGQFVANYNHLEIVSIGVFDFYRANTDQVIFRLKEVGKTKWDVENVHDTSVMRSSMFWPFGFVPISHSRGKQYEFEIQSTKGEIGNAIALLPTEPSFFTKYRFSGSFLINQPGEILPFLFAKAYIPFTKLDRASWLFLITLPLIPLIMYLLGLGKIKDMQVAIKANNHHQIFGFGIKKERSQVDSENGYIELFSKICIVLVTIVICTSLIYNAFTLRTKDLDWYVFEFISVLTVAMFLGLGAIFSKYTIVHKIEKWIRWIVLIVFCTFVIFLFGNKYFPPPIIFFLLLAFIPIMPIIKKEFKTAKDFQASNIWKKILAILSHKYFLTNVVSIFIVTSFFSETLLNTSNRRTYFMTWFLSSAFLSYIVFNYQFFFRFKLGESIPLLELYQKPVFRNIFQIILMIIGSVFLFLSIHGTIVNYLFYSHSAFYIGPAHDILQGKSLLYDTPSQYGYLSIHFVSLIQRLMGGTVETFDRFNTFLFVISTLISGLIFYKLTKKLSISFLLAFIFIGFSTFFSDYHDFLFPSSGPLRFGFGLLICFFLLYFPGRISFLAGTILSAISVFWSPETSIYVVPAWLFTCSIIAWRKHGRSTTFVKEMILKTGVLVFFVFILAVSIFLKEYRPESGLPNFYNFIQYAQIYKGGFYSILTPLYGNYYFYVFIAVLGLGVLFHILTKKLDSWVLPAFAYIAIYNVAIHSYFVYRSWYSLIINNAGFLVIELVLMYKILYDTKNLNQRQLKGYFGASIIIFFTLFAFKCYYNNPHIFDIVKLNVFSLSSSKSSTFSFLTSIAKDFNLDMKNIIVLSEYDTFYVTDAKVKNFLPLNPSVMTFVLPDWRKKYIYPKIKNIPLGTIVVFDPNLPDYDPQVGKFLISLKDEIKKSYELTLVGIVDDKNTIEKIGEGASIKRERIEIFKITAKKTL